MDTYKYVFALSKRYVTPFGPPFAITNSMGIIEITGSIFILLVMLALFIWVRRGDNTDQKAAALTVLSDYSMTDSHVLFHDGKFVNNSLNKVGMTELDLVNDLKINNLNELSKIEAVVLDPRGVVVVLLKGEQEPFMYGHF